MSDVCRICGKPFVDDDLVAESDEWEGKEEDNPVTLPVEGVCWKRYTGSCVEGKTDVDFLCDQRDKLIEENRKLQAILSEILGESIYVPKKSEMDRLEEAKSYVKGINELRRSSRPPV